jgi:dihydrodipicolinate reductase
MKSKHAAIVARVSAKVSAMVKILILGANGQLARNTTRVFLQDTDVTLTLDLRRASRLKNPDPSR